MTHTIVTVVATVKVKHGHEEQAKQALRAAVAPTRAEPGCLQYDLHQSTTDPTQFLFYEAWSSDETLKAHSASTTEHRLELRKQLGGLVDAPPSLTFWHNVG